ncbi:MAG: nucleoside triphosphate pyrophosphohydrolase [Clostridia bacterium]|nr:nucleoside triphosphate pyrophosphohydrolase [Clostridia bacterium]
MQETAGQGRTDGDYSLEPLVNILDKLLSPEGCPWDRQQTHFTLKPCLLEEAYEVIEAINAEDMKQLKEELGDVLLQVVFHAALAEQKGEFDLHDVVMGITNKMVRRHPHVFGEVTVRGTEDVLKNWEEIKKAEKGNNRTGGSIMKTVNRALPALLLAEEVQKRAKQVGFDWENVQGPLGKIKEELQELEEAIFKQDNQEKSKMKIEEELGDLLFAVVNVARFVDVSSEVALSGTIQKFMRRFNFIEQEILARGAKWEELNLHYLDEIWEKAKLKGL